MDSQLSQLLTALFSDSFDNVPIRTSPPRNVPKTAFNTPYNYTDLKRGAVCHQIFAAANESKNISLDICGIAVGATVGETSGLSCPPSAIVTANGQQFALWLLAELVDRETWQDLQNLIADKLDAQPIEFVPLPELNLVEFDGSNYSYEPITLQFLDVSRRYKPFELETATITEKTTEKAIKSENQGCKVKAAKSFLSSEFGKAARLQATELIKAARLQNISERTLRTVKAELKIESHRQGCVWFWGKFGDIAKLQTV
jgi:hypothetical protein